MAKNGGYYYNPNPINGVRGLPQPAKPAKPKPYVPSVGDLNEKAGGDQEMENRMQNRGPGRGPMSRNGMGINKGKPFTGGSTYRKP